MGDVSEETMVATVAMVDKIKNALKHVMFLMDWVRMHGELALLYAEDLRYFIRPRRQRFAVTAESATSTARMQIRGSVQHPINSGRCTCIGGSQTRSVTLSADTRLQAKNVSSYFFII